MGEPDPISEFQAWMVGRPWNGQVMVLLARGRLDEDDLYLESIAVPRHLQGQGIGRSVLAKLVEVSERHGIPLSLEASEDEEGISWLADWYARLGFEEHEAGLGEHGTFMVRQPSVPRPTPPTR